MVWIVNPNTRTVLVYRKDHEPSARLRTATGCPAPPAQLTRTPVTSFPKAMLLDGVRVSRATPDLLSGAARPRVAACRGAVGTLSCKHPSRKA